jgi:hypothetical protein
MHPALKLSALRLACSRGFSTGSISRGVRLPVLPQAPDPALPALEATHGDGGLARQPPPPPPAGAPPQQQPPPPAEGTAAALSSQLLADLERSGRVHKETLALMEGAPEWQGYEANVNFDLNVLRMRYAATPGVPMTPARRAQMQAHLRAAQAKVMEEHATAAARKFVDSLAPREVAALRDMVGRLDTPGVGAPLAAAAAAARAGEDAAAEYRVSAEGLKDALWEVSAALGAAEAKAQGRGRGGGGGGSSSRK